MVDTTGHGLSTIIIDNWINEIVCSSNVENCTTVIGQILKTAQMQCARIYGDPTAMF